MSKMSKIVEINGESLLELDKDEIEFMRMFIQCVNIKHYITRYKLWLNEDIQLYNEFINKLKEDKSE